ncbi:microtubule-associated proteins 1A/1B light chain 3B isoform X2 [Myotis myotis]|uniref:microtubule-associated proteins 1A/1B light chain 3B isoform X2 n=2 Tax=Myotis TaxID=9434 RepID=UPI0017480706|nr:microtubule-associated proteins 1A/1B light chain 3B isoform X2 [Myotis myotis]
MRRAHPTPRLRLCARPCFRHARYGGGGVHPWPRLLGRCAGHLTRLRAEETQGKSRSTPSGPPPPKAAGPSSSPPAPSLARHAVGEDLQAAPHLRTKSRRCPAYPRATSDQNPEGAYSSTLIKPSSC